MKLYEFCFSPTGGCRKVSTASARDGIARKLFIDLTDPEGVWPIPEKDDVCIFTAPAFAGRSAGTGSGAVKQLTGNGAAAILTAVYGNRAFDDTLLELKNLLTEAGFSLRCRSCSRSRTLHYAQGSSGKTGCTG